MNSKEVNKGRIRLPVVFGSIAILIIIGFLLFSMKETNYENSGNKIDRSKEFAESIIERSSNQKDTLLYEEWITIKGKRYQIRFNNNRLEVKKDDEWVDIEDIVGQGGAVLMQDGKLKFLTDSNQLIDLETGDILNDEGVLKQVEDDQEMSPFMNDRLFIQDGVIKYIDDNGNLRTLKEGEVINLDGKAYKMQDGVLKPFSNLYKNNDIDTNEYVAKRDKDGILRYYLKDDENIEIPVDEIPNGSLVELDGKSYQFQDGELLAIPESVKSLADLGEAGEGDYVVMNENGKPVYYKKINGEWVKVPKSSIPKKAIIYSYGKPYVQTKDGRLTEFKPIKGQSFIKGGKAYTISKNGKIIPLQEGDLVQNGDDGYYIIEDGEITDFTKDKGKYHEDQGGILFENGKPYITDGYGNKREIPNNSIVYRGLKPYRYLNGQFILLTKKEKQAFEENKRNDEIAKSKAKNDQSKSSGSTVDNKNNVQLDVVDDSWMEEYNAPIAIQSTGSNPSKQKANNQKNALSNDIDLQTQNLLNSIGSEPTSYQQQNGQQEKLDWLKEQQSKPFNSANAELTSPFTLLRGAKIPIVFETGINTDHPGEITAMVSKDVYDTVTGNYLLIPKGTRVLGVYDSQITQGQTTVLMAWNSLLLPNGTEINLHGSQGIDLSGFSGISGEVDNHIAELFKAVVGISIFSAGTQYAAGLTNGGDSINGLQLIAASMGQQLGQLGIEIFNRALNRQPTIMVASGRASNIFLTEKVVMKGEYKWNKAINIVGMKPTATGFN